MGPHVAKRKLIESLLGSREYLQNKIHKAFSSPQSEEEER